MDRQHDPVRIQMEEIVPTEWERLVRLCAHLSGSVDAADDLAQETLVEAWRHVDALRDRNAQRAWLSGIARNVCLRWRRRQAREIERQDRLVREERLSPAPAAGHDLLGELERDEAADLLDRALGTLPGTARDVLVLRYIEELEHREIAEQLGLSEGAIAVRLHRGKAALRQALSRPELRGEAIDIGLIAPDAAGWHETRIWCPFCGRHRLEVRMDPKPHAIFCRCTGRCVLDGTVIGGKWMLERSQALTSVKSILSRELLDLHRLYRQMFDAGVGRCEHCGQIAPVERWSPSEHELWDVHHPYGIRIVCTACGDVNGASLWHLLLDTPDAQRFWQRHPRMEALPVRELEVEGRAALLSGFASARGEERLEIVTAQDTGEVLRTHGMRAG